MPNFAEPILANGKKKCHVFHKIPVIPVTGVTYDTGRLTMTALCGARPGRCAHWPNGPVPHYLCWVPATGCSPRCPPELLGKWHAKIWDSKMARPISPSIHVLPNHICLLKLLPVWKHLKNAQGCSQKHDRATKLMNRPEL